MYGTIAKMRLKEGITDEQLAEYWTVMRDDPPPSSVGVTVYRSSEDPRTLWVAGCFESKEAYFANAATPEQSARFERVRAMTEGDPEWHDGEVVFSSYREIPVG